MLERLKEQRIDLDSAHPIAIALRTGSLQRVDDIDSSMHETWTSDDSYLDAVQGWPGRSAVVAPMVARGRTLGTIALSSFSERTFDDDDVRVIRELARRASFAVDNARLFGESSYIATKLQQSLLPPHLPEIPGVEIAARFRPAGETNDVGGDFYDIFLRGPDEWAITIGDVCGKGADAAAVTSLARHTLRATAMRGDDAPDELLRTLNRAMLAEGPLAYQFCTVALASFSVGADSTPRERVERRAPAADRAALGRHRRGGRRAGHPARRGARSGPQLHRDRAVPRRHGRLLHRRHHRGAHGRRHDRVQRAAVRGARRAPAARPPRSRSGSSSACSTRTTTELRDDVALVVAQIAGGGDGRVCRAAPC